MAVVNNPEPDAAEAEASTSQNAADSANVSQHYFMKWNVCHKFSTTVQTVQVHDSRSTLSHRFAVHPLRQGNPLAEVRETDCFRLGARLTDHLGQICHRQ